ncbi:MAG TPA: hypothetical protein VEF04_17080 [Blastocatellia bacterium]|nr:hypothetical protein [Blastocatellia bacterium]
MGGYMFILDLTSGKELYWDSLYGRASYGDVKAYKNDLCLIVISMWGYRDSLKDPTIKDHLLVWRGKEMVRRLDDAIPPGAILQVWGDKILAVTKKKESIIVEEIAAPMK